MPLLQVRAKQKAPIAALLQSPLTDSTVDPLLTMERLRQLVAAAGDGFGLFLTFPPLPDLR
jgi:hypothetical protein